jgi:hypothetical protein
MKFLTFFAVIFLLPTVLSAAFLQLSPSAKLAAVSDISALEESASSAFYNPAVFNGNLSLSSSYFVPFSLGDLSYKNIVGGYKLGRLNFATGFQEIGNDIYKEQALIVATNCKIIQNLVLGFDYRFLRKEVSTLNNENASQFDVGIMATAGRFNLFSSYYNISFSKIGNDEIPQESRTGVTYQIYDNLKSGICVVKEIDYPFSFHFGVSYYPFKILGIMSGFQTEPTNNRFTAGLEFRIRNLQINYGIKTHQYLDIAHYFTICYQSDRWKNSSLLLPYFS